MGLRCRASHARNVRDLMKTSTEAHLRTLFRRHARQFRDRESWPLDEISRLADDTLLQLVVQGGSVEDVKLLLKAGANVNLPGDMGFTALHYAMQRDTADIAEVLLEAGADPKLKNEWGEAPMQTLMHYEGDKPAKVFKQFMKLLRRFAR